MAFSHTVPVCFRELMSPKYKSTRVQTKETGDSDGYEIDWDKLGVLGKL